MPEFPLRKHDQLVLCAEIAQGIISNPGLFSNPPFDGAALSMLVSDAVTMTGTRVAKESELKGAVDAENAAIYVDVFNASSGSLGESQVRTAEVDAIVDTGATYMCLPPSVTAELGLLYSHCERVRTANGAVGRRIFRGAEITIRDRCIQMSVMENDEDTPPLIGCLVLEGLDFVVDPKGQHLMPNHEHGGEWVADLY